MRNKDNFTGYLFLLPNILGFLTFTLLPVLAAFVLSLYRWDIFHQPQFVGLQNFIDLLGFHWEDGVFVWNDSHFWKYFGNTLFFMISIPINMLASLLLAVILNQKLYGKIFFRTVFYLPTICVGIGILLLWKYIYNPEFGLLNTMLHWIGIKGPGWLTEYYWAKPAIMLMGLWTAMGGTNMILYLAGLQGISPELYEAAEIDGAGPFKKFMNITFPMLAPTSFFIFITSVIGGFQGGFEAAYIMTQGGPDGATTTLGYYIFSHAFRWFNMGYAAAISLVLFFIILCITMLNWKYGGKNVEVA